MKNRKLTIITVILLCSCLFLNFPFDTINNIVKGALDNASEWNYYKSITISNPIASYQMKIHLVKGTGTDNLPNGIFYLNNHCEDFPNDIRFGSSSNASVATQLPQWLQESNSTDAIYWINTTSSNYSTIFLFAGNENVSFESCGSTVFPWLDEYGYYFVSNTTATFIDQNLSTTQPDRPFASGSAITKSPNGTLISMYNSGVLPGTNGYYRAYHTYSYDNGTTWTIPVQTLPIGVQGTWSILGGQLGYTDNGTLVCSTLHWYSRSNCHQYMYLSYDNGTTWDDGELINWPYSYAGATMPLIKLPNGTMIVGAACDTGLADPGKWGTYLSYSDDNGTNWHLMGLINKPNDADVDEITIVQLSNGTLYHSSRSGRQYVYHGYSENGGWDWGEASSTGWYNGQAPQCLINVSSNPKRIVYLLHNNTLSDWEIRKPLNCTVSYDDCNTFESPQRQAIDKGYSTAYPHMCLTDDNCILIAYWNAPSLEPTYGGTWGIKIPVEWFFAPYWIGNVSDTTSTSVYDNGEFTLSGSNKYIKTKINFTMPFIFEMKTKVSDESVDDAIIGFGDTPGSTSYLPANGCAYVTNATSSKLYTRTSNTWHGSTLAVNASLEHNQTRKFVVTASSIDVYYNDTLDRELSTDLPSGDMSIWYTSKNGADITTEFAFVRKYAATEPSFSSSGGWTPVADEVQFIDINGGTNQTTIYDATPIFNWTKTDDASKYWLQIDDNSDFSSLIVNITDVSEEIYPSEFTEGADRITFQLPSENALTAFGTYYCRVRAYLS